MSPCSLRDFDVVFGHPLRISSFEVEDGLWDGIGMRTRNTTHCRQAFASAKASQSRSTPRLTIRKALYKTRFATEGRHPVVELYRDADAILEPGRSRNSVAPVIVSRPDLFLPCTAWSVCPSHEHQLDEEVSTFIRRNCPTC